MKILQTIVFLVFLLSACTPIAQEKTSEVKTKSKAIENEQQHEEMKPQTIESQFSLDYVMGKFDPADHSDFEPIDSNYADRSGMYLRSDAYADFIRMYEAAREEGITLQIRSAARNFEYQKGIWERKWTGKTKIENGQDASIAFPDPITRAKKILLYSSMPGTSRHHWGTDIDLNSFENDWFRSGEGLKLYNWMLSNAHKYGYCQPYTEKGADRMTGYEEERWHWSYMPISAPLTRLAESNLKNDMIGGFMGAEVAVEVDMVKNYVLGIASACRTSH